MTGGGTGGHAYPALSVAEALRKKHPDCKLLYIGSKNGPEAALAVSYGIPFVGLTSRKLRRALSPANLMAVLSLGKGLSQAASALSRFRPDVVVGTGGYAAAAVVMAQVMRRGKTLIHEQNAIPGRTNLLLSRFASKICVSFPGTAKFFPDGRTVLTGLPIRSTLLDLPGRAESLSTLGLDTEKPVFLVLGGSQGALALNRVVGEAALGLRELGVQVLHQSGPRNYDAAKEVCESVGWPDYHLFPYLDDMRYAYGCADLVLSRSGASTIAEITAAGLPSILVPYPHAYADHQRFNAAVVANGGGGVLMDESKLTADLLLSSMREMLSPGRLEEMGCAAKKLARPTAAGDIADIIERMC